MSQLNCNDSWSFYNAFQCEWNVWVQSHKLIRQSMVTSAMNQPLKWVCQKLACNIDCMSWSDWMHFRNCAFVNNACWVIVCVPVCVFETSILKLSRLSLWENGFTDCTSNDNRINVCHSLFTRVFRSPFHIEPEENFTRSNMIYLQMQQETSLHRCCSTSRRILERWVQHKRKGFLYSNYDANHIFEMFRNILLIK